MASTYDSPAGWYTELEPNEKRTFWACFGGWMLDAMDVQIFSFAIPAIIVAFAITNADAGLIGTVTLLTSALGGWFAGALSDRFGRVRTLQITIVWFAFFTFLCGFAQSYTQLFIFRVLMGLGFGGEWASGAELMGEVMRGRHRCKAACKAAGRSVGASRPSWPPGLSACFRRTPPGAHCSGSEYCRHSSSFSCGVLSTSQTCSPRHRIS